jgi:glycosyltransferase involved in cell wall biosynthesis
MCDTAISPEDLAEHPRKFGDTSAPLRLLWVGRLLPRKALPLALDALKETRIDATLTIAGDGMDEHSVRQMIDSRNLSLRVFWKGRRLTPTQLRSAYAEHDAMLFTSLRDSFGSQVLEALGMALPVISLDLNGVRDYVPARASLKVPVTSANETVRNLAAAIEKYACLSGKTKSEMSEHAWNFAKDMSWAARVKYIGKIYESICADPVRSRVSSPVRVAIAKP